MFLRARVCLCFGCLFFFLFFLKAVIKQFPCRHLAVAMLKSLSALHVHMHRSPRGLLLGLTLSSERRSSSNVWTSLHAPPDRRKADEPSGSDKAVKVCPWAGWTSSGFAACLVLWHEKRCCGSEICERCLRSVVFAFFFSLNVWEFLCYDWREPGSVSIAVSTNKISNMHLLPVADNYTIAEKVFKVQK